MQKSIHFSFKADFRVKGGPVVNPFATDIEGTQGRTAGALSEILGLLAAGLRLRLFADITRGEGR